jgi:hypothetical protein
MAAGFNNSCYPLSQCFTQTFWCNFFSGVSSKIKSTVVFVVKTYIMKKAIRLFCVGCYFSLSALAQNVGIGTTSPTESLDVTGNINVTGTIKANGVDGTANQVLMKSSNGALEWGNLSEYKNFKLFEFTFVGATQSFTIPAGVTKIAVEIWGAGGGGSQSGGGGAGGYALGIFEVAAGGNASIIVGASGAGATGTGSASNGGESRFTYNSSVLGVNGGDGASANFIGSGGSLSTYSSNIQFLYFAGGSGKKNVDSYQQASATDFYLITKYGNGGTAYGMPSIGGEGGTYISNTSNGFTIKEVFGSQGYGIGEGGGGGKSYGYPGAFGRVIVRW